MLGFTSSVRCRAQGGRPHLRQGQRRFWKSTCSVSDLLGGFRFSFLLMPREHLFPCVPRSPAPKLKYQEGALALLAVAARAVEPGDQGRDAPEPATAKSRKRVEGDGKRAHTPIPEAPRPGSHHQAEGGPQLACAPVGAGEVQSAPVPADPSGEGPRPSLLVRPGGPGRVNTDSLRASYGEGFQTSAPVPASLATGPSEAGVEKALCVRSQAHGSQLGVEAGGRSRPRVQSWHKCPWSCADSREGRDGSSGHSPTISRHSTASAPWRPRAQCRRGGWRQALPAAKHGPLGTWKVPLSGRVAGCRCAPAPSRSRLGPRGGAGTQRLGGRWSTRGRHPRRRRLLPFSTLPAGPGRALLLSRPREHVWLLPGPTPDYTRRAGRLLLMALIAAPGAQAWSAPRAS